MSLKEDDVRKNKMSIKDHGRRGGGGGGGGFNFGKFDFEI